jgi:hypothetical protein
MVGSARAGRAAPEDDEVESILTHVRIVHAVRRVSRYDAAVPALDPRLTRVVVDGATLLVPNEEAWEELERTGELDGRRIASGNILENHRALARRVTGLVVALGEEREPNKPYIVLHLAELAGKPTRMVVESSSCTRCDASALIGVTRHYDLYMGTENPLAAVRAHEHDPLVPCEACGAPYVRPAVRVFVER